MRPKGMRNAALLTGMVFLLAQTGRIPASSMEKSAHLDQGKEQAAEAGTAGTETKPAAEEAAPAVEEISAEAVSAEEVNAPVMDDQPAEKRNPSAGELLIEEAVPVAEELPVEEAMVVEEMPTGETLRAEETSVEEAEPVIEEIPVMEEMPAEEAMPRIEELPIEETAPVAGEAPAAEAEPVIEEVPVMEEMPAEETGPSMEELPIEETAPAAGEVPVAEAEPVIEEAPVMEEMPAEEAGPSIEDLPIEEIAPAAGEVPVAEEEPVIEEVPAAEELPTEKTEPVREDLPREEAVPVTKAVPAEKTAPVIEELPVEETAPVTEEMSTEEAMSPPEELSAEETAPATEALPTEEAASNIGDLPAEETAPVTEALPTEETASVTEVLPAGELAPVREELSTEEINPPAEDLPVKTETPEKADPESAKQIVIDLESMETASVPDAETSEEAPRKEAAGSTEVRFAVKVNDQAVAADSVQIMASRVGDTGVGYEVESELSEEGVFRCCLKGIPEDASGDGVYVVTAVALDQKGNTVISTQEIRINRYGSVYCADTETADLLQQGYHQKAFPLHLKEKNVDDLSNSVLMISRNGAVPEEIGWSDVTVTEQTDGNGWRNYNYDLPEELFAEEGEYAIRMISDDAAGNHNYSGMDGETIDFTIDRTPPDLLVPDLADGSEYCADEIWFCLHVRDNSPLQEMRVYRNGKILTQSEGKPVLDSDSTLKWSLTGEGEPQKLQFYARDAAGNESWSEEYTVRVTPETTPVSLDR